ncbi:MAG: polysaccharide biosynthesis protein [Candidatus Aenigmarchaeota archaeon]|nr:polysaccharide biosynthesis protein [Candidatus Aenigmarchaeota archaeon]
MKILMPTSPGGHLKQSLLLANRLKMKFDLVFVTYKTPLTKEILKNYNTEFVIDPYRGIKSLFRYPVLVLQALGILLKERPNAIVTPGSNIPIPFCYLGKLLGIKVIFIESWSRVKTRSTSGKFAYKIADLFFIQWKPLKKLYPKAVYAGRFM